MTKANESLKADDFLDVSVGPEASEMAPIHEVDIEAIKEKLGSAVSPLEGPGGPVESELDRNKRLMTEIEAIRKDQQASATFQRQIRLQKIKAWPNLAELATRFLLEISGAQPYRTTKTLMGIVTVTFETMRSRQAEQVIQQLQRDQVSGRTLFDNLDTFAPYYRAAMSIRSIQVRDPQTGNAIRTADFGEEMLEEEQTLVQQGKDWVASDLLPRYRYLYIRDHLLIGGVLLESVMNTFTEFEQELFDLQFLLIQEPDFFRSSLAVAS